LAIPYQSSLQGTFTPEPGPEQEALIHLEGEILIDLCKEHKNMSKRRGSSLKWQEMQMNE